MQNKVHKLTEEHSLSIFSDKMNSSKQDLIQTKLCIKITHAYIYNLRYLVQLHHTNTTVLKADSRYIGNKICQKLRQVVLSTIVCTYDRIQNYVYIDRKGRFSHYISTSFKFGSHYWQQNIPFPPRKKYHNLKLNSSVQIMLAYKTRQIRCCYLFSIEASSIRLAFHAKLKRTINLNAVPNRLRLIDIVQVIPSKP